MRALWRAGPWAQVFANMKTNVVMISIAVVAATMAVAGGAQASDPPEPSTEQCTNYGNQVAFSVTGNATIECVAQYCHTAPAGAGAIGTGVGVNGGTGDAGASASAGTGCEQSAGNDSVVGSGLAPLRWT